MAVTKAIQCIRVCSKLWQVLLARPRVAHSQSVAGPQQMAQRGSSNQIIRWLRDI